MLLRHRLLSLLHLLHFLLRLLLVLLAPLLPRRARFGGRHAPGNRQRRTRLRRHLGPPRLVELNERLPIPRPVADCPSRRGDGLLGRLRVEILPLHELGLVDGEQVVVPREGLASRDHLAVGALHVELGLGVARDRCRVAHGDQGVRALDAVPSVSLALDLGLVVRSVAVSLVLAHPRDGVAPRPEDAAAYFHRRVAVVGRAVALPVRHPLLAEPWPGLHEARHRRFDPRLGVELVLLGVVAVRDHVLLEEGEAALGVRRRRVLSPVDAVLPADLRPLRGRRVAVDEHAPVRRQPDGVALAAGGAAGFADADLRPVVGEEVEGVDAHVLQDQVLVACLVAVLDEMADVLVPLVPAPLQARREHHRLGHFGGFRVAVRPRGGGRGRRRGGGTGRGCFFFCGEQVDS
mmetsp:Transcript_54569/g.124294  ORF Transcript_54569/g.124294 Transcript_54569/m.124294 type:complete len:405 (+) Transcript_54569:925-2139(+)